MVARRRPSVGSGTVNEQHLETGFKIPRGCSTVNPQSEAQRTLTDPVANGAPVPSLRRIMNAPRTLYEKIWDDHVVPTEDDGTDLLFVDLHLVHEVTSPQAFEALELSGRTVHRPDLTLATIDHGVPTSDRQLGILDPLSKKQIDTLIANCERTGVTLFDINDPRSGIVHLIGPEQGLTQPGATIVCGDSHTATHGAFGSLAFGIGTSEVEHVLATQTLTQRKPKSMSITVDGTARSADITIENAEGDTEVLSDVGLPWSRVLGRLGCGRNLDVSAQNQDTTGDIRCRIIVAGQVAEEDTSGRAHGVALCSRQLR
jgi:hypothetical protein